MRESWIPLFQDIRNSSLWAFDSDIRIVWFTLLTLADPEGFVCAAAPGLAIAANVSLEKTRIALDLFESPDPDSRSTEHDGRRIEKVPRGWRLLTYADHQKRARHEAEKARKRRWAKADYAASRAQNDNGQTGAELVENDNGAPSDFDNPHYFKGFEDGCGATREVLAEPSENLDASKSKSKSSSLRSEETPVIPSPPVDEKRLERWRENTTPIPSVDVIRDPAVLGRHFTLDGLDETGLEDEAVMAGMSRDWFRQKLAEARNTPIGGTRGVRCQRTWVKLQFGKWKTWEEDARARAANAPPKSPRGGAFSIRHGSTPVLEANAKHKAFAARHGIDLAVVLRELNEAGVVDSLGLVGARKNLEARLTRIANDTARARRQAEGGAA